MDMAFSSLIVNAVIDFEFGGGLFSRNADA